ncbi:hypothetical protein A9Q84_14240 [Halobacteriovorax marinus]|mgnify:CR=1 FL=1|uniref:Uncharacterized protein n=1 Tax=Halobacteriovorax marinus TaxID=97084 RepID=A0A1Y5F4S2_9BACT|nr:hypothetical protein A9Q84_14240 [Halobacteriovorax marinus]
MKFIFLIISTIFLASNVNAGEIWQLVKCTALTNAVADAHYIRKSTTYWTNARDGIKNTKYIKATERVNDILSAVEASFDKRAAANDTQTIKQYAEDGLSITVNQGDYQIHLKRRQWVRGRIVQLCDLWPRSSILRTSTIAIGRIVSPLD